MISAFITVVTTVFYRCNKLLEVFFYGFPVIISFNDLALLSFILGKKNKEIISLVMKASINNA